MSGAIWQIQEKAEELKAMMVLKPPAILQQGLKKGKTKNQQIPKYLHGAGYL